MIVLDMPENTKYIRCAVFLTSLVGVLVVGKRVGVTVVGT